MGRPRRNNSEELIEQRRVAGERFKMLRTLHDRQTGKRYTQNDLARILEVDISTIRRYESGKYDIPDRVAEKLAGITNTVKEFWTGESLISEPEIYVQMQAELAREEAWYASWQADMDKERFQWKYFFSALGYTYEDTDTADIKKAGEAYLSGHNLAGPHSIKKIDSCDPPVLLESDELYQLIKQLRDAVGYFCYKHTEGDK